jgi:nucleotide-binding universal stress UspA family protein
MSIKTILVAASGGDATKGAVETGFALARRLGAHVEIFHAAFDEREAIMPMGDGMMGTPVSADLIDRIIEDGKNVDEAARRVFDEAAQRHGLPIRHEALLQPGATQRASEASVEWRSEIGAAPDLIARRARGFDLVVLGRSDRVEDQPHSGSIEAAVLESGRPVLLAAPNSDGAPAKCIAIGWNDSVEAVHALAASLPLLHEASVVRIITIGTEDEGLGALAVGHLAWHGIAASARLVQPVKGTNVGSQLLSAAREEGAELLVMGAYGKAPWRELLFGGATREVVGVSLMPLLLAH